MAPFKAIRTYEKRDRNHLIGSKKSVEVFNALLAQNISKRILNKGAKAQQRRKLKVKIRELPPRTAPYMSDDSVKVAAENTFDKLLAGEIYNKVEVKNVSKKVNFSESDPTQSKSSVSVSYHSPILTRKKKQREAVVILNRLKDLSSEEQVIKRTTHTYLDKSVSTSLSVEKCPAKDKVADSLSLCYIKLPKIKENFVRKETSHSCESCRMEASYEPVFSETFKEKQYVHSSTPCITTNAVHKIVVDQLSPIRNQESKLIQLSYNEVQKWGSFYPVDGEGTPRRPPEVHKTKEGCENEDGKGRRKSSARKDFNTGLAVEFENDECGVENPQNDFKGFDIWESSSSDLKMGRFKNVIDSITQSISKNNSKSVCALWTSPVVKSTKQFVMSKIKKPYRNKMNRHVTLRRRPGDSARKIDLDDIIRQTTNCKVLLTRISDKEILRLTGSNPERRKSTLAEQKSPGLLISPDPDVHNVISDSSQSKISSDVVESISSNGLSRSKLSSTVNDANNDMPDLDIGASEVRVLRSRKIKQLSKDNECNHKEIHRQFKPKSKSVNQKNRAAGISTDNLVVDLSTFNEFIESASSSLISKSVENCSKPTNCQQLELTDKNICTRNSLVADLKTFDSFVENYYQQELPTSSSPAVSQQDVKIGRTDTQSPYSSKLEKFSWVSTGGDLNGQRSDCLNNLSPKTFHSSGAPSLEETINSVALDHSYQGQIFTSVHHFHKVEPGLSESSLPENVPCSNLDNYSINEKGHVTDGKISEKNCSSSLSDIIESSQIIDLTEEAPNKAVAPLKCHKISKPKIIVKPGKSYRRSLSLLRRTSVLIECSDLCKEGCTCFKCKLRNGKHNESGSRRSSIQIVPVTKSRRSGLQIYANETSSCYVQDKNNLQKQLQSDLEESIRNLSLIESQNNKNNSLSQLLPPVVVQDKSRDITTKGGFILDESITNESAQLILDLVTSGANKGLRQQETVTARDLVLQRCGQAEPLPFEECYPADVLDHCQKIGEGVYGEVFLYRNRTTNSASQQVTNKDGDGLASSPTTTVIKIIPIEGDLMVNGEKQKKFDEILSEIVIAMELSRLRNNDNNNLEENTKTNSTKDNYTCAFNEVKKVTCVQGQYPERLLDLWELYEETHGSENDSPKMFPTEQLYVVLELANGGQDLEAFTFTNASQAYSMFKQVACALAVAECQLKFEHRDLHWGNILLTPCDKRKKHKYRLGGVEIEVPSEGVEVAIIDFTLSRIEFDGVVIYNDLSQDDELFDANGDYQFEIYRLMQNTNRNNWQDFRPYTNLLWLHYLLDKATSAFRYRNGCTRTKIHKEYMKKFEDLKAEILAYVSVEEFVYNLFL